MWRSILAGLVFAAVATAAPVPKALKKAPTLNGAWEATTLRSSGNDFLNANNLWVWEFEGENVTRRYRQKDGTLRPDGPATITRPDAAKPSEIDYHLPSGNQTVLFRARIEVTADELVINFAETNDPRPPDMTELKRGYFYRFKRVEAK
jgi:hypothetical protein